MLYTIQIPGPNGETTCSRVPGDLNTNTYNLCFYNASLAPVDNTFFSTLAPVAARILDLTGGECYCQESCNPPQLVCRDKIMGNPSNGLVQFAYLAERFYIHCYCPQCYAAGEQPCSQPTAPNGNLCPQ